MRLEVSEKEALRVYRQRFYQEQQETSLLAQRWWLLILVALALMFVGIPCQWPYVVTLCIGVVAIGLVLVWLVRTERKASRYARECLGRDNADSGD